MVYTCVMDVSSSSHRIKIYLDDFIGEFLNYLQNPPEFGFEQTNARLVCLRKCEHLLEVKVKPGLSVVQSLPKIHLFMLYKD